MAIIRYVPIIQSIGYCTLDRKNRYETQQQYKLVCTIPMTKTNGCDRRCTYVLTKR
jgi:hypothetical protein